MISSIILLALQCTDYVGIGLYEPFHSFISKASIWLVCKKRQCKCSLQHIRQTRMFTFSPALLKALTCDVQVENSSFGAGINTLNMDLSDSWFLTSNHCKSNLTKTGGSKLEMYVPKHVRTNCGE